MRRAVLLLVGLLLAAGCGQAPVPVADPATLEPSAPPSVAPSTSASPSATPTPTSKAGHTVRVEITFYAGADNDPPGSAEIAYPNSRHQSAGGTGTWADPLTLASAPDELPVGTLVYVPRLKKYFVMEDDCEQCISEWARNRHGHVDLWVSDATDPDVITCEESLTLDDREAIEIDPPRNRPVDPRPLHDVASGSCWPDT